MLNTIYIYLIGLGTIFAVTFICLHSLCLPASDTRLNKHVGKLYSLEFTIWSVVYLTYTIGNFFLMRFPETSTLMYADIHLYGIILLELLCFFVDQRERYITKNEFGTDVDFIITVLVVWVFVFPIMQSIKYLSYYILGQEFTITYTIGLLVTIELAIFFLNWDWAWERIKNWLFQPESYCETYIPEWLLYLSSFALFIWSIGYPLLNILNYFNIVTEFSIRLNNPTLLYYLMLVLAGVSLFAIAIEHAKQVIEKKLKDERKQALNDDHERYPRYDGTGTAFDPDSYDAEIMGSS
jgi:hypothetical protein